MRYSILCILFLSGFLFPTVLSLADTVKPPAASAVQNTPSCFVFIRVEPNGELTIVERLKGFGRHVQRSLNSQNRTYSSLAPFVHDSVMEVLSATVDGKPVPPNVYTRDKDESQIVSLTATDTTRSSHEYTITYKARDRILFRADNDSLDWDIWGLASLGVPLRVSCAITLPEGAVISKQWSRLGHETRGHRPVAQWINDKGAALFRGEEPMAPSEHFVVSVTWNKGIVTSDGSERKIYIAQCTMWGLFLVLLLACWGLWFKFGKDPRPKVTMPLFYPPLGPDGEILSPAAVAYIRNAAILPSRGFAGLLLNLAAQKMLQLTGTGRRKDPYILTAPSAIIERTADCAANPPEHTLDTQQSLHQNKIGSTGSLSKRRLWERALVRGCGFDLAERLTLLELFPDIPPQSIQASGSHSWQLANARATAYTTLTALYRNMWQLRGGLMWFMFLLCYGSVCLVQGTLWFLFGGDIPLALAAVTVVGGLSAVCYFASKYMVRIWAQWHEMGPVNLSLFGLFLLLLPVVLLYDGILDQEMANFYFYDLMQSWAELRILLWLGLGAYFIYLTRSFAAGLLIPLKVLGFLLLFLLAGGTAFYCNSFMGSGNLALVGALLLPLCFMPIMKRPAPKAVQILADIEGFAMYIGAAETQRLNFLNPPERTPEEYHRVLPYAVALGLEKAWGAQFAGSLAKTQLKGSSLAMLAEYELRMRDA